MQSCLLVEDHRDTRDWLALLLIEAFPGLRVHEADTLGRAHTLMDSGNYDLAVIDLGLPDGNGLEIVHRLAIERPDTFRLVATIYDDDRHVFDALRHGAEGYLLKEESGDCLKRKLQAIADGEPPLSPRVALRVLRHFRRVAPAPQAGTMDEPRPLTNREVEVLHCISRGCSRGETAEVLDISSHTVADHVKSIYRKLHVSGRAEASLEGVRRGLIQLR